MKTKKQIVIDDFSNTDKKKGIAVDRFYNLYPNEKSGLTQGYGVKVASLPRSNDSNDGEYNLNISNTDIESVEGLYIFKQYFSDSGSTKFRLLVYGDDQKMYVNEMFMYNGSLNWLYELTFDSTPVTLAFKKDDLDAIIIASEDKMIIWATDYSPYTVTDAPIITSMCMNDGVLYCTLVEPAFKIWYATDLKAENIGKLSSNSGYITLADELGYAKKIVAFNESVYVFREYGISKISAAKTEFTVSQVYISRTQILTNTVSACGNVILFFTKEGLYSFNGVKVTKTDIDISDLISEDNSAAVAESFASKYYLACKLDFGDDEVIQCEAIDGYKNNALLVVDILDYSYQIVRGVDIKAFLPVLANDFERMLVIFNSENTNLIGQIIDESSDFEVSLPKYWKSHELSGDFNVKLFTRLVVDADKETKFKLIFDDEELPLTTHTDGINEFSFKIPSKQIYLEISTENESVQIKKAVLDYYEY